MGSHAQLYYGDFSVLSTKGFIALESLLMFVQEDLRILINREDETGTSTNEIVIEEDEEDIFLNTEFLFTTTAKQAKARLNTRGITLDLCKNLFTEFRANEVHVLKFPDEFPAQTKIEEYWIDNPVDFEIYMRVLSQFFHKREARPLSPEQIRDKDSQESIVEKIVFGEDLFIYEVERFFDDVSTCIFLRCLIEAVPDDIQITLDFSELVHNEYILVDEIGELFDSHMKLIFQRIEIYYKIYGFVIEDDPTVDVRLRERIAPLDEDLFINHVLHPILTRIGYERLRRVSFHGPNEFGSDILPFRYVTPLGTLEYYALQAKAVPIHGTSSRSGNAAELISQAVQAFAVSFVDDLDNERKRIDKFVIATNKNITTDARRFIEDSVEKKRQIVFLDIDRIIELVKKHRLLQYLLFSDLT